MEGKTREFLRKTRENEWDLDSGKIGKRGIAKGYLGLQGRGDETRAVDESEKPLSCGKDLESDFRGIEAKPSDSIVQSLTGRIAEG